MSYRIHHQWKQLAICLCLFIACSCSKSKLPENPEVPVSESPTSLFEALYTSHGISYLGSTYTSDFKIKDGSSIGTVVVGNDGLYLYLTYNLSENWYITSVQSYAGPEMLIPVTSNGNPEPNKFPARNTYNICDLIRTMTFRVPLSSITADPGGQCNSEQYFIAMKATVQNIGDNDDCNSGINQDAWAAPVVINPGNSNEWAMAFYYCKQIDVQSNPIGTPWNQKGQGYWFAKPNVQWCEYVTFGNLVVSQEEGKVLWPAKNNLLKKIFFKASSLQLSLICNNPNQQMPASINEDYKLLYTFLSGLSYEDIQNGTMPVNTDIQTITESLNRISLWICNNATDDPTACIE